MALTGWKRSISVIAVVLGAYVAFRLLAQPGQLPLGLDWDDTGEGLVKIGLWVLPCIIALRLFGARTYGDVFAELGLDQRVGEGYLFGFLAAVPLLAILPISRTFRFDLNDVIGSVILGPFAEEVLFRGFLFRQLFRQGHWHPAIAMIFSALVFGLAHLSNVELSASQGMFLGLARVSATASGGLLFAWIVYRWRTLWPAIGLHAFMNLSWEVSGADDWTSTAHATTTIVASGANIARVLTIAIAVALTLARSRRARPLTSP